MLMNFSIDSELEVFCDTTLLCCLFNPSRMKTTGKKTLNFSEESQKILIFASPIKVTWPEIAFIYLCLTTNTNREHLGMLRNFLHFFLKYFSSTEFPGLPLTKCFICHIIRKLNYTCAYQKIAGKSSSNQVMSNCIYVTFRIGI